VADGYRSRSLAGKVPEVGRQMVEPVDILNYRAHQFVLPLSAPLKQTYRERYRGQRRIQFMRKRCHRPIVAPAP